MVVHSAVLMLGAVASSREYLQRESLKRRLEGDQEVSNFKAYLFGLIF